MGKARSNRGAVCAVFMLAVVLVQPSFASEPDRYLFDRASEVYRVFATVRVAKKVKAPTRSLASISPIIKDHRFQASDESLALKIQTAIRSGVVQPGDIQLPNASSHGTQDSSKIQ